MWIKKNKKNKKKTFLLFNPKGFKGRRHLKKPICCTNTRKVQCPPPRTSDLGDFFI